MNKPDTNGMPDKLSPEFAKRFPHGVTVKAFLEALWEGWKATVESSSTSSDSPGEQPRLFPPQP